MGKLRARSGPETKGLNRVELRIRCDRRCHRSPSRGVLDFPTGLGKYPSALLRTHSPSTAVCSLIPSMIPGEETSYSTSEQRLIGPACKRALKPRQVQSARHHCIHCLHLSHECLGFSSFRIHCLSQPTFSSFLLSIKQFTGPNLVWSVTGCYRV